MALKRKRIVPLGRITNPALGTVPGSFTVATNVVFRRPGVASLRRGAAYAAAATVGHRRLFPYDGGMVGFFSDGSLAKRSSATWVSYSGTYTDVDGADAKLRAVVANSNLFLMTGTFAYRLSGISGTIEKAGAPRGVCFDRLGPTAVLVTSGGFLADQYQVAYRVVIAKKDSKENVHFGEPSSRTIVANATFTSGWVTTESKNVVLRAILAAECTTDHYFQVYRSKQVPVGTQPDDDLQLVYQDYLTTLNIANKYVEFTDTFPETVAKGAYIHTSPNFAHGIGEIDGENGPPPQFKDAVVFKDRLFGFNYAGYPTFQLTILGVGGTAGIQANDALQIVDGLAATGTIYTATTAAPGANAYKLVTTGSTSQNLEQTALNLVEAINKDSSNTFCYAVYASGPSDIPGKILLIGKTPERSSTGVGRFQLYVLPGSKRTCFDPVLAATLAAQGFTLNRSGTTVTATTASGNHSFRVGEQVTISLATGAFTNGTFTVLTITASTFTYTQGSGTAGPVSAAAVLTGQSEAIYKSALNTAANGFCYSKVREMEAFPLRNFGTVGEKSVDVGRSFALKDSIVVWTFNGLFRLTGDSPETFAAEILDPTIKLIGREAACQLGEASYAWTTRGLVEVTDSGWKVLSKDIDLELVTAYMAASAASKSYALLVGSEQQKMLELYLPAVSTTYASSGSARVLSLETGRWSDRDFLWRVYCSVYDPATSLINYGTDYDGTGAHGYLFTERLTYGSGDNDDDRITSTVGPTVTTSLIAYALTLAPFRGLDPHTTKNWQEVMVLFERLGPSTSYTFQFSNDLADSGVSVVHAPDNPDHPVLWVWPNYNMASINLIVSISGRSQEEFPFELTFIEFAWEEFGTRVVR